MAPKHARTPDVFFDDGQRTPKRARYVVDDDSSSDESEVELVTKPQHSYIRREYLESTVEDDNNGEVENNSIKNHARAGNDDEPESENDRDFLQQLHNRHPTTGGKTTSFTRLQELINQDSDNQTEYDEQDVQNAEIDEQTSNYGLPECDSESLPMASSPPILRPGQIWGSLNTEDERRRGRSDGPRDFSGSELRSAGDHGRDWGLEADRKLKLQMQYAKGSHFGSSREAMKARMELYKGRYRLGPNQEVSDDSEQEAELDSRDGHAEDDEDYEPHTRKKGKKREGPDGSEPPGNRSPQQYGERTSPAETMAAEFPLTYTFFPQSTRKQGYSRVWDGSNVDLTEDEESEKTRGHGIDHDVDESGAERLDRSSKFDWDSNDEDDIPEPENDHDSDADFGDSESDASDEADAGENASSRRMRATNRNRGSARRSVDKTDDEAEVVENEPVPRRVLKRKAHASYVEESSEDERPRKMSKSLAGKKQRVEKIPIGQSESSKTKKHQAPVISRQTAASISGENATKTGVVADTGETQPMSSRSILKPTSRRNKRVIESASEDSDEQTSAPSQQELTLKRSAARPRRTMSPTKPATTQLEIISEERSRYIVIGGPFQAPRAIGKRQISKEVIGEWERKKAAGLD